MALQYLQKKSPKGDLPVTSEDQYCISLIPNIMEIQLVIFVVLPGLMGTLAQEDLERKVFIFPESSNTSHVVLKSMTQRPLTSFTICLRAYTDMTRSHTLFSYATRRNDNEIVIFKNKPNEYSLYVGTGDVIFYFPEKMVMKPNWEHICMSWESDTGLVEFWLDGKPMPRNGMMKGYRINGEASIVLGQDQDSFGGGFDINQSFVGEMMDVYMWDRVLSDDEICLVWGNRVPSSPIINWRALMYDTKSYVILKPSLLSICKAL